jgi:hypothetical protein
MKRTRLGIGMFLALLAGLLGGLLPATTEGAFTIDFSFRGYANNVKVEPPLIGPFQLGTARIHGSGVLGQSGLQGTIVDVNNPLFSRYPGSSMRAEVISYSYKQAAHAKWTRLTMTIQVTHTDAAHCAAGDQGTLTLYESAEKLSNGERSDHIVMGHWGGRCPAFVQGWTNEDGGRRTSPHFGGPPHGGQWAIVNISP